MQQACVTAKCNSVLDKIVQTILPVNLVSFLNTQLIKTSYIYLNLWSFVHVATGMLFFLIWYKYKPKKLFLGLIACLLVHTIWEIIEFMLALKGLYPALFYEEFVDIAWDTIVNLIGYALLWFIFYRKARAIYK